MPDTWEYEIGDTVLESDHELSEQELVKLKQQYATPATGRKMGWLEAMGRAIPNVPSSAKKAITDNAQLAGAAVKFMSNPVYRAQMTPELPGLVASIPKALGQRFGSVDAIKQTLAEDPVGLALDVTGMASLGGGLARATGRAIRSGGKAAYKHGLGVNTSLQKQYPKKDIAGVGFEADIAPTRHGMKRITDIKDTAHQTRDALVNASTERVDPVRDILSHPAVMDTGKRLRTVGDVDPGARDAFVGAMKNYADAHSYRQPVTGRRIYKDYPIQNAEIGKEHLNVVTQGQRGKEVAAGKALTDDAMRIANKDVVARKVPGVAEQNKIMDDMIPLEEAVHNRVMLDENEAIMPLRAWLAASAAGLTSGDIASAMAAGAGIKYGLSRPMVARYGLAMKHASRPFAAVGNKAPSLAYSPLLARLMSSHEQP